MSRFKLAKVLTNLTPNKTLNKPRKNKQERETGPEKTQETTIDIIHPQNPKEIIH